MKLENDNERTFNCRWPSTSKILKLVITSGIENNDLLIDEIGNCSFCLKYKKAPLKPIVGLSLSKYFNDVASIDLREINDHKI